jgi:hypothetical protein
MDAASRYNPREAQESVGNKSNVRQTAATVLIIAGLVGIVTALMAMPARYLQGFLPF